jgi:hypothetical protein
LHGSQAKNVHSQFAASASLQTGNYAASRSVHPVSTPLMGKPRGMQANGRYVRHPVQTNSYSGPSPRVHNGRQNATGGGIRPSQPFTASHQQSSSQDHVHLGQCYSISSVHPVSSATNDPRLSLSDAVTATSVMTSTTSNHYIGNGSSMAKETFPSRDSGMSSVCLAEGRPLLTPVTETDLSLSVVPPGPDTETNSLNCPLEPVFQTPVCLSQEPETAHAKNIMNAVVELAHDEIVMTAVPADAGRCSCNLEDHCLPCGCGNLSELQNAEVTEKFSAMQPVNSGTGKDDLHESLLIVRDLLSVEDQTKTEASDVQKLDSSEAVNVADHERPQGAQPGCDRKESVDYLDKQSESVSGVLGTVDSEEEQNLNEIPLTAAEDVQSISEVKQMPSNSELLDVRAAVDKASGPVTDLQPEETAILASQSHSVNGESSSCEGDGLNLREEAVTVSAAVADLSLSDSRSMTSASPSDAHLVVTLSNSFAKCLFEMFGLPPVSVNGVESLAGHSVVLSHAVAQSIYDCLILSTAPVKEPTETGLTQANDEGVS